MTPEEKELRDNIKSAKESILKGGMTLTEQTNVELYMRQWQKDLKNLKKQNRVNK